MESVFESIPESGSTPLGHNDSFIPDLPRDIISAFRNSAPKSRNGCITCKVKCDEEKPECKRCRSSGRKCHGYAPPKPTNKKKTKYLRRQEERETEILSSLAIVIHRGPAICKSPSADIQADSSQRRSFHYFRSRNFSQLPGNFEPYFWDDVMLQFSHSYPSIQQSLIALSAIYVYRGETKGCSLVQSQRRQHALQQYNIAVRTLKNIEASVKHLDSGMRILTSLKESGTLKILDSNEVERDDIYGSLSRSFTRLRIQVSIHGSTTDDFAASCPLTDGLKHAPIPHTFSSIFESRISLDAIFRQILGYLRKTFEKFGAAGDSNPLNDVLLSFKLQDHIQQLEQWHMATTRMRTIERKFGEIETESEALGYAYLQLYHMLITTCAKVLFQGEMIYDHPSQLATFSEMLSLSSLLLHNTKQLPLSFDMGVIPPLLYVTTRCRVLSLLMRALELLKLAPEQEGLWVRDNFVRICEWKIATEEAGRGDLENTQPLPESVRIYQEQIFSAGNGERARVTYRQGPFSVDGRKGEEMVDYIDAPECVGRLLMTMYTGHWQLLCRLVGCCAN
ncbi:hypothetical protein HYALB_00009121 [Hymenoscyphus albidus]|uniref:Zn(2)-C6 fungal-type domain-containing protein n=1 Tax=Hymenoscyphus albidus TaxID=595503 RepID=A0A9N9LNT1_9HELO|nr:hypothetical protein HYALB_00009121 [Hymenoscyphus albidus]